MYKPRKGRITRNTYRILLIGGEYILVYHTSSKVALPMADELSGSLAAP